MTDQFELKKNDSWNNLILHLIRCCFTECSCVVHFVAGHDSHCGHQGCETLRRFLHTQHSQVWWGLRLVVLYFSYFTVL